jgi:Flp pilus assembly protein TadG
LLRDDGRVSVFFAILAPALIAMLGLVIDGGGKIRAIQRADNIAAEAARAAGQAINAPQAILGGTKQVDPDLAAAAARSYITAAGATCPPGCVRIAPDLQHITVTVQVVYDTAVLGFIGIHSWTVTGTTTATLVAG